MSQTSTNDGLQALVRSLAEALYNDPAETPLPMATDNPTEVIHAQLTENTGTHFLDSGSAYGRHWEENEQSPPWGRPAYTVGDGFVTHNVAHFMERNLDRDRTCVALEAGLYAYANSDDRKRDSWLACMRGFANALLDGELTRGILNDLGVPEEWVREILAVQRDVRADARDTRRGGPEDAFTHNTYNGHGTHGLSQVLQGTNVGGPYADYVFMQVHQGCDVRGGYTGPRVYTVWDSWIPGELSFNCTKCDWHEAESILEYDDHRLLFQREVDEAGLFDAMRQHMGDASSDAEVNDAVADMAAEALDDGHTLGGVFHVDNACGGIVHF